MQSLAPQGRALRRHHSLPEPACASLLPPACIRRSARVSTANCRDPAFAPFSVSCAASSNRHCSGVAARAAGRTQLVVAASWGAPVEFSSAKVLKNKAAAQGLHQLTIDVGSLASGYTKPGQFIQIKVGDSKPGFFAIASAPDVNNQGVLEFLIKSQPGATAEMLCNIAEGAEVSVSPVMGKGFPVERIPAESVSSVYMFATGSGISPLKALIESDVLQAKQRKEVKLYYGTRSAASTAFTDLIPKWEASGVKVSQVFSEAGKGYVQDVFAAELNGSMDPSSVGVVLCGQKDMCQKITAMLTEKGVAADKILLNF